MPVATSRVFSAVFPPPSDVDLPTPSVTPLIDASSTFEDTSVASAKSFRAIDPHGGSAAGQIKWDRAWHTATTFLTLPAEPIQPIEDQDGFQQYWCKTPDTETKKAFRYLLDQDLRGRQMRPYRVGAFQKNDLLRWYFEKQIVVHLLQHMEPLLNRLLCDNKKHDVERIFDVGIHLELSDKVYMWPVEHSFRPFLAEDGDFVVQRFKEDIHGIVLRCLPRERKDHGIRQLFRHQASIILDVDMRRYGATERRSLTAPAVERERQKTKGWVSSLRRVGLGGHATETTFAEVMDEVLEAYVRMTFSGKWSSPSHNAAILFQWISTDFVNFVALVLEHLEEHAAAASKPQEYTSSIEIEQWQETGLYRLGTLRTEELFRIVSGWNDSVHGAIEDLKAFVKTPGAREYLTNVFSGGLRRQLLQPSASTNEILQFYISVIRAFTLIDPRGVLLDRVARPVRRYLRERDDTVAIVISGLLANPDEDASTAGHLGDLAVEMSKQGSQIDQQDGDSELDFDDMEWMPDPVDAGPDYKKSNKLDVIGSLISLFESKDIFVREFQHILGERLLRKEQVFEREIRVLELLKARFGEASLQACEVMLRDVLDSRRLDAIIRKDPELSSPQGTCNLHSRILSHLYWPSLHSDHFTLPPEIERLQDQYAANFEVIKYSRKLSWLHALGQVTVELEFEDRKVTEEVQTWQASVIYAFQYTSIDNPSEPVSRSIPDLIETLEMPENLVLNALTFWVGKMVLKPISSSADAARVFAVLETLANEAVAKEGTQSAAVAAAAEMATAAAAPAVLSESEVAKEKMGVYSQYVIGMLTNGGAMPMQQIVMMLKMTVPGGFPFGNEELKIFLEDEVREGRLDYQGGAYRIRR